MTIMSKIFTKWATPEAPEKAEKVRISYTDCSVNWQSNPAFTPQKMTPLSADIDFLAHYQRNGISSVDWNKANF